MFPAQADGGCPDGQPCVVVRSHGSVDQQFVVDLTTLDRIGDVSSAQYRTFTGRGGIRDDPFVNKGASVLAILRSLNLDTTATRVTAASGPNAHQTLLDQSEIGDPSPYQFGLKPVFFTDNPQFIRFVRPMRDDGDANYQDYWSSDSNAAVYLDVYTSGRVVHPVIRASALVTKPGRPVGFAVGFVGYQPAGVTYAWSFGDGRSSAAAAPTHAWTRGSSSFSVNVSVRGADDASGSAQPVVVRVGKAPPKTKHKKPGTGSGGAHNPVTGPATGGGQSSGGATSGAGTAPTAPTATPAPAPTPSPTPKPRKKRPVPVAVAGDRVEGVLLVSASGATSGTVRQPQLAPPRQAASARAVGSVPRDRRLLWGLLLPGVLLVGALGQTRWVWRRRPTLPWRI